MGKKVFSRRGSTNHVQDLRNNCLGAMLLARVDVVFTIQHHIIMFFGCVNPTSLILEELPPSILQM